MIGSCKEANGYLDRREKARGEQSICIGTLKLETELNEEEGILRVNSSERAN